MCLTDSLTDLHPVLIMCLTDALTDLQPVLIMMCVTDTLTDLQPVLSTTQRHRVSDRDTKMGPDALNVRPMHHSYPYNYWSVALVVSVQN